VQLTVCTSADPLLLVGQKKKRLIGARTPSQLLCYLIALIIFTCFIWFLFFIESWATAWCESEKEIDHIARDEGNVCYISFN
jgi:hypothetical protein